MSEAPERHVMPPRKVLMDALCQLWSLTHHDWDLTLHHCLTEPTCPSASVQPEGHDEFTLFWCSGDTIDEAIDGALFLAYSYVINGNEVPDMLPFSNPGDDRAWLRDAMKKAKEQEEARAASK